MRFAIFSIRARALKSESSWYALIHLHLLPRPSIKS
jgi:hypothetical protein